MPNLDYRLLIPFAPWHWTTILHYLVLLGALAMLFFSGEEAGLLFILAVALLALLTGLDLYIGYVHVTRVIVFFIRTGIFVLPIVNAGTAKREEIRVVGGLTAFVAMPLFALVFLSCVLGPPLGDPRILPWCG
jgi:hypothetical protein